MSQIALTIAGSDPSGGAGIQADLKVFQRFGVYGQAVISLLTAQNSRGVLAFESVNTKLLSSQISALIEDMPPHAIKTGALSGVDNIEAVSSCLDNSHAPLVVDPILKSSSGLSFHDDDSAEALVQLLFPKAYLVTPNSEEAAAISGTIIDDQTSMKRAAELIAKLGPENVLITGGHLEGDANDLLFANGEFQVFSAARNDRLGTHGTGCVLSAAITAELAKTTKLSEAIDSAKRFITEAIKTSPGLGRGNGPLNLLT